MQKLIATLFLLLPLSILYAQDTIYVPGDYATIQEAINAANNGNIVLVAEDTYYENINFKGKAITVASHFLVDGDTSHISNTIIDGSQPTYPDTGSVVLFINGEDTTSVLCGFSITGGTGTLTPDIRAGGGIAVYVSGAKICSNIIEFNTITNVPNARGAGIYIGLNSNIVVKNNVIRNNTCNGTNTAIGGGLLIFQNSSALISNNKILDNTVIASGSGSGGGIDVWGPINEVYIISNLIKGNSAHVSSYGGGGIDIYDCTTNTPVIENNVIKDNFSSNDGGGILVDLAGENHLKPRMIKTSIETISENPLLPVILTNNTIIDNSAEVGGGIYCNSNLDLIIINNTISGNTADYYGGIFAADSDLQIDSCNFNSNESLVGSGGGLRAINSDLQINGCTFAENISANRGGALRYTSSGTSSILFQLNITNTSFENNTSVSGGGVYVANYDSTLLNVVIDNCNFLDNIAERNGGLRLYAFPKIINFTLSNSIFAGNEAQNFAGGFNTYSGIGTVTNCLFASNDASTSGGNYNSGGVSVYGPNEVDFMNCTFVDNSASYGAGLTVGPEANLTTTNCIFWGNSTDQIALDTSNGAGGTLTINYCDIQDGENSINVIDPLLSTLNWGDGNIDVDPLFVDPLILDYDLQNTSPCIGTAIDTIEINGIMCYCPPYDIEGNPRPDPIGSMPDIGAYESPLANPVGVEENETGHPTEYALYQNYPNPFNPTTTIIYGLKERTTVELKIFDILGREVVSLVSEEQTAGYYEMELNASYLPSGVYFYRLKAGDFVETRKMVLMK